MINKIIGLSNNDMQRVLQLLGVSRMQDLERKNFNYINPASLVPLYQIAHITPHELIGREPPDYKIRIGSGLDRESTYNWITQRFPEKKNKFKYLITNPSPLPVKKVVEVLDFVKGIADLKKLTDWR